MKIKIILLLLALAIVAPMLIPGPDGEPIMTTDDWKVDTTAIQQAATKTKDLASDATKLLSNTTDSEDGSTASDEKKLYKWQDSEGNWHFSDAPTNNEDVKNLSAEEMPTLHNELAGNDATETEAIQAAPSSLLGNTGLGQAANIKNDAEEIQRMAKERVKFMDQVGE